MKKNILDIRKILHFLGAPARAKAVFSERAISLDTASEEKRFAAGPVWRGMEDYA